MHLVASGKCDFSDIFLDVVGVTPGTVRSLES